MKRKYYILGVLVLLCLLGTGYYAWTLYDAYRKQVAEWNEGAKAAFEEALWMEVNKRAEVPMYHSSSEEGGVHTLKTRIPDSVSVMTMEGFRKYKIEKERYERSFIKETNQRAMLGALLNEYPLSIDTLASNWNKNLSVKEIPARYQIRYIYTDLDLNNDTIFSVVNNRLHYDSLSVNYLGFRCEHELTAFISYPYWFLNFSWYTLGVLLLWGLLVILFKFYTPIESFIQRRMVKEKVIEKEVYVTDVVIGKSKLYRLPDGSLFDTSACTLTKGGLIHTLPPQSAILLKLFLYKENHYLSIEEIDKALWNGLGSSGKIHKAMQRLRDELKKVSPDLVIKTVSGGYELK
jgi:hypothetical protein